MRLRARWAAAALLLLVPLIGATDAAADNDPSGDPGRPLVPVQRSASAVPGQYIVTLKPEVASSAAMWQLGIRPLFTYKTALHGFAAALSPEQLAGVREYPGVESVEENGKVSAGLPLSERSITRGPAATWGQDRIDQRGLPLDSSFTTKGSGKGVTAYIVDTGIETAHSEFGGRATTGFDAITDGRAGQDCNGHGTHVAGTTGGATYGVARSVSLVSVRVLDCEGNGTWAGILAGFDWVVKNAKQPAVLNASLGGPASRAVDEAANAVTASGVLPVVAAGNESVNACDVSPARAGQVVAVGAIDPRDRQTDFSNFGECLWLYAPGAAVRSAALGGGSVELDGTSMASPYVTGVAVLYKEKNPAAAPKDIALWLADQSSKDVLSSIGPGSPNRLLYTGGF